MPLISIESIKASVYDFIERHMIFAAVQRSQTKRIADKELKI